MKDEVNNEVHQLEIDAMARILYEDGDDLETLKRAIKDKDFMSSMKAINSLTDEQYEVAFREARRFEKYSEESNKIVETAESRTWARIDAMAWSMALTLDTAHLIEIDEIVVDEGETNHVV